MAHAVEAIVAPERHTAVIGQATTWEEFPSLWPRLLDEVRAFLDESGLGRRGLNVMLYRGELPEVEVGVLVDEPILARGRVRPSVLPGGKVATTVHRGRYEELGAAHEAVLGWCAANGRQPAGVRWEVYGHHREDPTELETEVCWLLR